MNSRPIYFCKRCGTALKTDALGNHWCKVCQVYRPPFRATSETVTAPPLTIAMDENMSTRRK